MASSAAKGSSHEQKVGAGDEGAADGHALTLSAGKLHRKALLQPFQTEFLQHVGHGGGPFLSSCAAKLQGQRQVVAHGFPGKETVVPEE